MTLTGIHVLRYSVIGRPVPKGRPRTTKAGHTYTPPETRAYEKQARAAAAKALADTDQALTWPMDGIYHVTLGIYCATAQLPDADNVFKAVTDAATGVLWSDDKRVGGTFWPVQVSKDPRVDVEIRCTRRCELEPWISPFSVNIRFQAAQLVASRPGSVAEWHALAALYLAVDA